MRVPPSQSFTRAAARASASSGSRWASSRVMLVSRVAKTKLWTRRRRSASACRKCRNSREYSAIEPEMSTSATMRRRLRRPATGRRGRSRRRRCAASGAGCAAGRPRGRADRARAAGSGRAIVRQDASRSISRRARAISAALIWAKSLGLDDVAVGGREPRRDLALDRLFGSARSARGRSASRTRVSPASASPWRALGRARPATSRRAASRASPRGARTAGRPRRRRRSARAGSRRRCAASSRGPSRRAIPAASTAPTASTIAPGPTGRPAARSARANRRRCPRGGRSSAFARACRSSRRRFRHGRAGRRSARHVVMPRRRGTGLSRSTRHGRAGFETQSVGLLLGTTRSGAVAPGRADRRHQAWGLGADGEDLLGDLPAPSTFRKLR